jgi:hypothetical protein
MGSTIYGGVCTIRLTKRLLRQTNDLWMLGESTPGMRKTANSKRGKRPAEESSRRHTVRNSPVETSSWLPGWGYV